MTVEPKASADYFFDDRWEQDRLTHFYFLDTPAYKKLSTLSKHIVLRGHRGTGKTTLLRALDWRERLSNEFLQGVLGPDVFSDGVVGCFLQIKHMPVEMIDSWLLESTPQVRFAIIASYLRASWIVEACDAVLAITAKCDSLPYDRQLSKLSDLAETFWSWAPLGALGISKPQNTTLSIANLRQVCFGMLKQIRNAAAVELRQPSHLLNELDLLAFGQLTADIFVTLRNVMTESDGRTGWIFRVCLDEGEYLSTDWVKTVRSLIRETDSPVYLAVSVLRTLGSQTRATGATLSIDDREEINLDDRSSEQMVHLLSGIVRARLKLAGLYSKPLDLKHFLSNPDLDDLASQAVKNSESPVNNALFQRAAQGKSASPIRAYLLENKAIPDVAQSRQGESVNYRKKKTAGYLRMLGDLGVRRPFYAGWRISVAMSDNSVRDFIRFLRYCFEIWSGSSDRERAVDMNRFFGLHQIPLWVQDGALARLGAKKIESLPQHVALADDARRIIDFLGEVSHQIDYAGDRRLKKPNASRLTLQAPTGEVNSRAHYQEICELLEQCASYGYVSELQVEPELLRVSLHVNLSMARHYGFSYWKPQYSTAVRWNALESTLSGTASRTRLGEIARRSVSERQNRVWVTASYDQPTLDGMGTNDFKQR